MNSNTAVPHYRRPAILVAVITLMGAVVRLWNFPTLGLEHFDEGIYAFAGLWSVRPGGLATYDPTTIAYAPPGFPILVGLSYLLSFPWPGVSDLSAIAPAELCGIAAIPLMYWIGARTFNKGAGIAAAALLAAAGPHVAFSRMALTDAPFLLAWLAALGLGGRFLERPGVGRAVAFGLAVGVAQNVKYNGWLIGAIVAVTVTYDLLVGPVEDPHRSRRTLRLGLLAALVAALVYAPWFVYVELHGGYGAVLKHQRGYVMPASSWLSNLRLQLAQWVALSGFISGALTWGAIGWGLAGIGRAIAGPGREPSRWSPLWGRVTLLGGIAAMGVLPNLPWWLALGLAPWLLRDPRPAVRLVGAGWIVMTILTPFYHPYARLMLPLQGFSWLIVAQVIGEILPNAKLDEAGNWPIPVRSARGVTTVLAVVIGFGFTFGVEPRPVPYPALLARTDSMKRVAAWIVGVMKPPGTLPVEVYARPALTFYLNTAMGVPTVSLPDYPDFTTSIWRGGAPPERWVVTDEVLYLNGPSMPGPGLHGEGDQVAGQSLNITTLLDADPRAAYGVTVFRDRRGDPTDWRFSQTIPFTPPSARIVVTPQWYRLPARSRFEARP
jgi:4-amino-4-deoxy-L-arabinose transferase-like glycosyltransferase